MRWIKSLFERVSGSPAAVARDSASAAIPLPRRDADPRQDPGEPGFSATAGDQLRSTRVGLAREQLKLRAVLTPAQPVSEMRAFAGRREVLSSIISAIEDQRLHVVVYGSRGMGKTSLLHILTQRARTARYLVLYGSCGVGTTFEQLFRCFCKEVPLQDHRSARTGEQEAGRKLAELLPSGDLTPGEVGEALGGVVGTRLLIILDEFDRSDPGEFRQKVADLIKNLSDRAARVQLVIAGVASNLAELVEHIPSVQRNILGLRMPPMTDAEVRHLFKISEEEAGITFEPAAAEFIVRAAGGWAYLASLLTHHAALHAIQRKSSEVGTIDIDSAVRQALDEVTVRLPAETRRSVAHGLSTAGLDCLGTAARLHIAEGGAFSLELLNAYSADVPSASACRESIELLAEQRVLLEATEDITGVLYTFVDSIAPLYLWLLTVVRSREEESRLTAGDATQAERSTDE